MRWEEKTLDQLGSISRGKSKHRPRNDPKLFGGQYPFIQTADVKNANFYITEYTDTYNEQGLAQSKLWEIGTLCITIAANIADTAILAIPACFPDSIMGFIPYKGISDARFVKYCFDMLQQDCKQISQGTAQDNLSWQKLSTIKFPAPPVETQRRIADILSAYDNLIENNRKQIKLLEEAAQRLYKEWFVDLRFPGHEHIRIVDGVPEGWKKEPLSAIADVTMGQSPKSEFYNHIGEGLPFHQGVGTYGTRFVKNETYTTSYTRIAEAGSILFSVRAPVGRLNLTENRIAIGRGIAALNHKSRFQSFLFYMLKERFFKDNLVGNGSIFASISKDELLKQQFVIPLEDIVKQYDEVARNIDDKISAASKQVELLTHTRDRLLPRLMSREVEL